MVPLIGQDVSAPSATADISFVLDLRRQGKVFADKQILIGVDSELGLGLLLESDYLALACGRRYPER